MTDGARRRSRPARVRAVAQRTDRQNGELVAIALLCLVALALAACTPTVKVEAPKEPITINLNVQADVRVTLEEAAKKDIAANPGVF